MSIATAITAAQGKVADCYTAISNKGGTLPATQNLSNMPTAINSIPSGGGGGVVESLSITPTTSAQTITASGGVDGYSPISVSAVTSSIDENIQAGNIKDGVSILGVTGTYTGGGGYSEFPSYKVTDGVANRIVASLTSDTFSNILSISRYGLQYSYYDCDGLSGVVDFRNLETISNYGLMYSFYSCSNITGVDLRSLTSLGTQAMDNSFNGCTSLASINVDNLNTVDPSGLKYSFFNTAIVSVGFNKLATIGSGAFYYTFGSCKNLTDVYFNAIKTTTFSSYINQFSNMFDSSTASTSGAFTMHFPSNLSSTISGLTGYPNFGATSGRLTLSFDLPATS